MRLPSSNPPVAGKFRGNADLKLGDSSINAIFDYQMVYSHYSHYSLLHLDYGCNIITNISTRYPSYEQT